jgi:transposase-like protein
LQEQVHLVFAEEIRFMMQSMINRSLESERDGFLNCEPYERTEGRQGYRNGHEERHLDTLFGPVRVLMPRVAETDEPFRPLTLDAYQRRQKRIDEIIVELVARGLSTREAARMLKSCFGATVSPATISNVVAQIDALVDRYHQRSLARGYRWLYLDGKRCKISYRRRRRGRGKKKDASVLVAFGVRYDGVAELVDYRVVDAEDGRNWEAFLTDLERRGLKRRDGNHRELQMIVSDGDMGLLGAMEMVWPTVPKQRCIFHKVKNIADYLHERENREAILDDASAIYRGLRSRHQARCRLRRWVERWRELEPDAVRNFQMDFDHTLTYLQAPEHRRRRLKTNNIAERFIKELNRKIQQTGIFVNAQSLDRAVFLVWQKLQANGYPETADEDETLFPRII